MPASARIGAAALALGLCACTFVKLEEQGKGVTVARANEVASCDKVGDVSTSVIYKLLFVNRSQTKVARELETLARNRAGGGEGNRVVATSPVERGTQTFDVYRCP